MTFSEMTNFVDKELDAMSLQDKSELFNNVLYFPTKQFTEEQELKDYLAIVQNWLSVKDYEKLYKHLSTNK